MKRGSLILVVGGARSGKSSWAEELAEHAARKHGPPGGAGELVYIATAEVCDDEMADRVRRHRARRPPHWRTVEAPFEAVGALSSIPAGVQVALVDCLTLYVSNWLLKLEQAVAQEDVVDAVLERVRELVTAAREAPCDVIVVTNEVGAGVVPAYPLGRLFRDVAGLANQLVAREADRVYAMVAGIPVDATALDARRALQREGSNA